MRSAGTKAIALVTTSGLIVVLVTALYFSSVLIQRRSENHQEPPAKMISEKPTTASPVVNEEFVKPIKKWPPPFHFQDVLYPEDKQMNNDHHSGHYRERVAQIWDPHPEYEFKGFGRIFHLQLSQNQAPFVVPNLKVAHIWDNVTRLEDAPLSSGGCFYSGKVVGDPASNVFVNLCHGMTGHIRTSNGSFLIEPAEEWVDYKIPIRHILRKMSNGPTSRQTTCHTPEKEHAQHDESSANTRSKRSLSQEYYLELMVVADRKMAEYHGKDISSYILNLMAMASHIFKDATIGNMITVTVVSLIIAKDEDFTGKKSWMEKTRGYNISSSSASEMLAKFCSWQYKNNVRPHDSALLITRENICSNPLHEKCETLGLAEVGRVCHKEFSCALVKDNGLGTAFTIAHELGHVLNMPHDEDPRCTSYNVDKKSHVMARVLDNNTFPWSWSECSRHILTEFLHAGSGKCMLNPPQADILPDRQNVGRFLGEVYGSDKQCELVFGPGWMTCNFRKECRRMWCSSNATDHHECRTGHMPWADGTPCTYHNNQLNTHHLYGPDGWCHKGDCVPRDKNLFNPVDGEWGKWQEYGECSRTCGGGIKKAIRLCDSPPPENGGRYCIGQRVRYKSCNTQNCPPNTPDFREMQCAQQNNKKFIGKGIPPNAKWAPKYGGVPPADRCKLYCRVISTSLFYILEEKVIDGTPCGPENAYDICVDGTCHRTGCDHILNSKTELDMCGVCGGDNSTCLQKRGSYNESRYGYSHVVRIPKGASNLDIRQYAFNETVEDNNYIALMDSDSGGYILNGNFIITMFKKLILYEGTTLEYTGSGNVVERVNSSLPLNKDLIIEVLSVKDISPPNVVYEYTVQKNPGLYKWELDREYTQCDKECHGERWRDWRCINVDEELEVAEEMCDEERPPKEIIRCHMHCKLLWEITSRSDCSNPCGLGERTVSMKCVKAHQAQGKKTNVHEEACYHLPRPPRIENCTGACDKTGWKYSPWGSCSVTCGDGRMERTAKCVDIADRERDSSECDLEELKITETCSQGECPRWEADQWTPCSVTCGRGYRRRLIYCKVGNRVVKSMCTKQEPVSQEPCELGPCPYWKEVGEWSACSATCGTGVTSIKLECSGPDGCNNVSKPLHTKPCSLQPCSLHSENAVEDDTFPARYSWRQKWGGCSTSCGHGTRTKTTHCFDNTNDRVVETKYCPPLHGRSFEVNTCYTRCPQWKAEEWEPCSAICGEGFESRKVYCEGESGQVLPDENCTSFNKPEHERKCKETCLNTHDDDNSEYEVGPWSECSVTCGIGEQYRNVQCRRRFCFLTKPPKIQACNKGPCYSGEWKFGNWSACNATCGHGFMNLEVFCMVNEMKLPDHHCLGPKPRAVNSCFVEEHCEKPRWRTDKWSTCSLKNCTKTRRLYCTVGDERVEDNECSELRRPKTMRPCKRICPNGAGTVRHPFIWRPGAWSQCSAVCGRGLRTRAVHCVRPGGRKGWQRGKGRERVADHHCMGPRPIEEEYCEGTCGRKSRDIFTWEPGPWKPCSHPCSKKGKQERTLHCYNAAGSEVPRRYCPKNKKPPNRRKCEDILCPSCRDMYLLKKEENPQDGEYELYLRGPSQFPATVYCAEMTSGRPREYITVPPDNYAMVYHEDIRRPSSAECPEQVTRSQCPRYMTSDLRSGYTIFHKLALNITSLSIITDDWTFAKAVRGYYIPIGEAGDCFSRQCPQGSFKINLQRTSFSLSRDTKWHMKKPHTSYMRINRAEDGKYVEGRCGGCCGMCLPKDGIRLDLAPP